mmetsp:Transcript_76555/g.211467  ORF Transcript_76555/g.211467 Transcript_76555/m.211467 type:complete len:242 (-) Transcript_76555:398-1123(-)
MGGGAACGSGASSWRPTALHQAARERTAGHRSPRSPSENVGTCNNNAKRSACVGLVLAGSKARMRLMKSLSRSFRILAQRTSVMPSNTATASSTWQTTAGGLRKERSSARSLRLTAAAAADTVRPVSQSGEVPAPALPVSSCTAWPAVASTGGAGAGGAAAPSPAAATTSSPTAGFSANGCFFVLPGKPRVRGCKGCTAGSPMSASVSSAPVLTPPSMPRGCGLATTPAIVTRLLLSQRPP